MGETKPYFGYGSNLDAEDWANWCKKKGLSPAGMDEIGVAYLQGYEMKFHYYSSNREGGAADVVKGTVNSKVPGALFTLSENAWKVMDRKEGHPKYYERRDVIVQTADGGVEAITYTVVEERKQLQYVAPTPEYVALIRSGLERRNLSTTALDDALE